LIPKLSTNVNSRYEKPVAASTSNDPSNVKGTMGAGTEGVGVGVEGGAEGSAIGDTLAIGGEVDEESPPHPLKSTRKIAVNFALTSTTLALGTL
jgi:hypothetical protein